MYKNKSTRSAGCVDGAKAPLGYVETDPSGRYGRVSFSLFFLLIWWMILFGNFAFKNNCSRVGYYITIMFWKTLSLYYSLQRFDSCMMQLKSLIKESLSSRRRLNCHSPVKWALWKFWYCSTFFFFVLGRFPRSTLRYKLEKLNLLTLNCYNFFLFSWFHVGDVYFN